MANDVLANGHAQQGSVPATTGSSQAATLLVMPNGITADISPQVEGKMDSKVPEPAASTTQTKKAPLVDQEQVKSAVQSAGKDWKKSAEEAGRILSMVVKAFFRKETVTITLDQIITTLFMLGCGFQVLMFLLIRPSYFYFFMFTVLGLFLGLVLSFLYYKNIRRKVEINQVLGLNLGLKGMKHLLGTLPSWVSLTDTEKMEWLNKLLEEVWPFYDRGICKLVKEEVEKVLDEQLKAVPVLRKIYFKHLTFGDAPFRVESIWVDKSDKALLMDLAVRWSGDANITLAVEIAQGAKMCPRVTDISFVGTLRVSLTPLVNEIPGFAAATVSFKKPPIVKYRLNFGNALGGKQTAGIVTPFINHIIRDVLVNMLVWPQRLVVPILNKPEYEDDIEKLKLHSKGVLRVTVVKAKDLKACDIGGKSDPMVELTTDLQHTASTKSIKSNLNPVWNETFYLLVQEPQTQELRVTVNDVDTVSPLQLLSGNVTGAFGAKEFMGRCAVRIRDAVEREATEVSKTCHLGRAEWSAAAGPGKGEGTIDLRLTYRSFLNFKPTEPFEAKKGIVLIELLRAKEIPFPEKTQQILFFIKVKVKGAESWESKPLILRKNQPVLVFPNASNNAFYDVKYDSTIRIKVLQKGGLTAANDQIGAVREITVTEVAEAQDINPLNTAGPGGKPEPGFMRRWFPLDEADSGELFLTLRYIPYFE